MLSQATYTEEQIKQILQQVIPALKKRLHNVTDALKSKEEEISRLEHELEAKSVLEDENDTLAQQLIRLKSHFQEKIKHLEAELEQAKQSPHSSGKETSAPLDTTRSDLLQRERLQKQALESSLIHLQDLLTKAQKERQQTELELGQTKGNAIQLERVIAFLRDQLDEFQRNNLTLRGEKDALHKALAEQAEKTGHFEQISVEKERIEQLLKEKEGKLLVAERDIGLIKQSLLRGLKELKELETRYEEALKEKGIALQKFQQSHLFVEKLRSQVQFLQEQQEGTQNALHKAQQELEEVRSQAVLTETGSVLLQEKLSEMEKGHTALFAEKNTLKGQLFEKEGELLQAQQHLAKKVKEVAQLEEKNDELRLFVNELQQVQTQSRVKLAELQTATDFQNNLQKKLEEQQQDLAKTHELQLTKWEEKYFAIYEKWQAAEARLKELEKLEDKQKQLQGILANLGTVLNPTVEVIAGTTPLPTPVAPTPTYSMQIPAKSSSNLFDRPKTPKVRQTFLE